jgi:hypothetical protein
MSYGNEKKKYHDCEKDLIFYTSILVPMYMFSTQVP